MPVDARRSGQPRRHCHTGRVPGPRRAEAIVAVTREAQLLVDHAASIDDALLLGGVRRPATPATESTASTGGRRIQDRTGDDLHASRLVRVGRRLDRCRRVWHLPLVHRQHGLDRHVDAGVLRHPLVVASERLVSRLVECFARSNRLDPHARFAVFHQVSGGCRIEGAEPFERPEHVKSFEQIRRRLQRRLQRRHDRFVLLQHEQLLCRVSPPAVGMSKMCHELRSGFFVHARDRRIARERIGSIDLHPVIHETPDSTLVDHLVQVVLLNARTQVGSRSGPLRLLDDAVIHVGDVDRAVGRRGLINRTEVRIG